MKVMAVTFLIDDEDIIYIRDKNMKLKPLEDDDIEDLVLQRVPTKVSDMKTVTQEFPDVSFLTKIVIEATDNKTDIEILEEAKKKYRKYAENELSHLLKEMNVKSSHPKW